MKVYIYLVTLIFFIVLLLLLFTFNPMKNYFFIKNLENIIDKIRVYESEQLLSNSDMENFYNFIDFSEEELLFIELKGLHIEKKNNGYLIAIPRGFDDKIFYETEKNCWYGNELILGLPLCQTNL